MIGAQSRDGMDTRYQELVVIPESRSGMIIIGLF
jgi:hypothetical protein